jgi:hypothetical protein
MKTVKIKLYLKKYLKIRAICQLAIYIFNFTLTLKFIFKEGNKEIFCLFFWISHYISFFNIQVEELICLRPNNF